MTYELLEDGSSTVHISTEDIPFTPVDSMEVSEFVFAKENLDNQQNHYPEWDSLPDKYVVNDAQTVLSYFKAFVGTGVLFLPSAFANGGLAATVFSFIVSTWLSTICMLKLVETKNQVVVDFKNGNYHGVKNPRQIIGFGMLGEIAIGPVGLYMVDISIAVTQVASASAYLVFISKNLFNAICSASISETGLIWIAVVALIPFMFIRQLSKFRFQIIIADFIIISGLIYLYVRNSMQISDHGVGPNIIQFDKIGFWSAFGTSLFALEGTAFVLPIEHAMRNKQNFRFVTLWSGIGIGFLYMSFGLIGYIAFGDEIQALITVTLKSLHPSDISITVLQIAYCIALLFSYPVVMFPAVKILENYIFSAHIKSTLQTWRKNIFRSFLVLACGGLATVGGTSFDHFVSLIGGLMCVPLTLVYPAYFHLKICYDKLGTSSRVFNYFIVIFGTLASIVCTVVSIMEWNSVSKPDLCFTS